MAFFTYSPYSHTPLLPPWLFYLSYTDQTVTLLTLFTNSNFERTSAAVKRVLGSFRRHPLMIS